MEIDYEIISLYIENKLSSEQKLEFEIKLKTDENFRKEYEIYTEVENTLSNKYSNQQKVEALKQTFSKIIEPEVVIEEKVQKSFFLKNNLFKIASLAAILIVAFFVFKPQPSLYNQFAHHAPLEVQVKGNNDALLLEAAKLFNKENYKQSIPKLDEYLVNNPSDEEVKMYLGIAFLETNQIENAQILFSQVYGQESVFRNKAAWYMALAYLKLEDLDQTRAFLQDVETKSSYYNKAQEMLKELN